MEKKATTKKDTTGAKKKAGETVKRAKSLDAFEEALKKIQPKACVCDFINKETVFTYSAADMLFMFLRGIDYQKKYEKSPEGKLMKAIFGEKE